MSNFRLISARQQPRRIPRHEAFATQGVPVFRLLSPAEYALLSAVEKSDYLGRLMADIKEHQQRFRADNKRLVQWVLHKDDARHSK